jgi:hypothetical protein
MSSFHDGLGVATLTRAKQAARSSTWTWHVHGACPVSLRSEWPGRPRPAWPRAHPRPAKRLSRSSARNRAVSVVSDRRLRGVRPLRWASPCSSGRPDRVLSRRNLRIRRSAVARTTRSPPIVERQAAASGPLIMNTRGELDPGLPGLSGRAPLPHPGRESAGSTMSGQRGWRVATWRRAHADRPRRPGPARWR